MSLLMCLDINIVLKTRRVAQLIAYPPPAISTTINIWLVFQEKKIMSWQKSQFANYGIFYANDTIFKLFRSKNVIKTAAPFL